MDRRFEFNIIGLICMIIGGTLLKNSDIPYGIQTISIVIWCIICLALSVETSYSDDDEENSGD